jgi:hypothetical protein
MRMSNRNDENMGIAIVFTIFAFAAIFLSALVAFAALIFTILSFLAWNKPLKLGSYTITPDEAHTFVYRGIAGAVLVPVFAMFAGAMFKYQFHPDIWFYLVVGGYSFGSPVIGIMQAAEEHEKERAAAAMRVYEVEERKAAPVRKALPVRQADPKPFKFADWNDEDEFK